jgi:hypothetical protein
VATEQHFLLQEQLMLAAVVERQLHQQAQLAVQEVLVAVARAQMRLALAQMELQTQVVAVAAVAMME